MRIKIRRTGNKTAVLTSFDTESEKFDSNYERNKFFSKLYGRKQIIIRKDKRYVYRREGLLDEIPHIKVDNSVFIVAMEHLRRMEEFFREWEDKVLVKSFPVLLEDKEIKELRKEIKIDEGD